MHFDKYQGAGNDFLVVAGDDASPADFRGAAERLCDRHFGVGGDGILLTGIRADGPFMHVVNADGSEPEMCGNGLRCVALHLYRAGEVDDTAFVVQTGAGPHHCTLTDIEGDAHGPFRAQVSIEMRVPSLIDPDLPTQDGGPFVEVAMPVKMAGGERTFSWTAVSMGNPHAVCFDDVGEARLEVGPLMERDAAFPSGVNVGFARMTGAQSMDLHVWERGAGWTLACGTGACAAAVAAVQTGRASRELPIEVRLPGGTLRIDVREPGSPVRMTGPAEYVFSGTARRD